jgi:gp16 family phage-associated protein
VTPLNSSLDDAKAQLKASGTSIRQWASKHGFSEHNVHAVLGGKNKATRGESFRIAVALGIKARPSVEDVPDFIKNLLEAKAHEATKTPTPSAEKATPPIAKDFWHQRLINERQRVGLKQSDLAALGGVSRATQLGYESGRTSPTLTYIAKIQDTIDVRHVLFDDAGRIK